jgi:serine/threonine-protein kinase
MSEAAATIREPSLLGGRYRLEERLGEGALGVVWRARHLGLHRDFALKLLRAAPHEANALARFQREAEALGRLRHPNVVEVTDFGVDAESGVAYLVMELLPGRTLADLLREEGALAADRALPLLDALAAAIDAAHAQGILHRDLKPGNVAVSMDEAGEPLVKVLDFGLAEIAGVSAEGSRDESSPQGSRLTSTGALLGTPLYAAPEVIRDGSASQASDIYSLGVIAYEMLTGHPPFQGPVSIVLARHLGAEPPVPRLPKAIWQTLREPLAKEPGLRPATAESFVHRLRQAVEQEEVRRWQKAELPRRLLLAATVASGALAAGLLLPPDGLPSIERRLDDLRMGTAPPRAPDPRLLLVTLDEPSLREGSAPLAGRADEIGHAIDGLFAAGARGVAIDLLLPAQWQESPAFTEAVLRHPEALTLAAFSPPKGSVTDTDCVAGLVTAALGPQRAADLFGFVNLDEDPGDHAVRRGRLSYRELSGGEHLSWAARAAASLGPVPRLPAGSSFWIDHRIDSREHARLPWRNLAAALAHRPGLFHGRLILIGSDSLASGDDYHRIPAGPGETIAVSSLTLQALQVDTITAGLPIRQANRVPILLLTALLTGCAGLVLLLTRHAGRAAAGLAGCAILYAAASLPAFQRASFLLPVTSPCLTAALGLAAALALRFALPPIPQRRNPMP